MRVTPRITVRPTLELALTLKREIENAGREELCGCVFAEGEKLVFERFQNQAPDKTRAFEIAPEDLLPLVKKEHAIIHSHPSGDERFSNKDLDLLKGVQNAWVVTLSDDKLVINTRCLKTFVIDENTAITQNVEPDITETHRYVFVFSGGGAGVAVDDASPGSKHTRC